MKLRIRLYRFNINNVILSVIQSEIMIKSIIT
jgi:hypothetical protein